MLLDFVYHISISILAKSSYVVKTGNHNRNPLRCICRACTQLLLRRQVKNYSRI